MFRENLQKLVSRLDGAVGSLVMGFDGIALDSFTRDGQGGQVADLHTVAMEFGHLVGQARGAAERAELGGLREVTIRTDKLTVVMLLLTKDYFLACGIVPTGNVGKARYLVKLAAPQIRAELQ
ncbi:MAG TPA: roadblock/LC7 domain-containing protein [Polyangia bacterium]|jgi:predicted regulator of Ras-like GTPase activity (Roadblock/LC7/MglB family)